LFAVVSAEFVEATVSLVRLWKPDLVVHSPLQGAGPLAAAVAGVPSVVPMMGGVGALRPLVAAAGAVDAEFVLAMGDADLSELGALPDNLRPVGWVARWWGRFGGCSGDRCGDRRATVTL
jgi:hypothetical protein